MHNAFGPPGEPRAMAADLAGGTSAPAGDRRAPRLVLAVGVVVGLGWAAITASVSPDQIGIAADVYYHTGRAVLAGADPYAVAPPDHPGYLFLYPPVVAPAFVPHALLGSELGALALQALLNVAAAVVTVAVFLRALRRRGVALERVDRALLGAFALLSAHALPLVVMGQVTLPLAAAMAVGFDALERDEDRLAGVALAAAALVKLFPAVVGAWLLRRRADRATLTALATGLSGVAVGLLLGPDLTVTYALEVLPGELQTAADGAPSPDPRYATVRRQLAALFGVGPPLLAPLGLAVLVPPTVALYRRMDGDVRRLTALLGTLVATMLFLSLEPLYFPLLWYPLVVLLYRLPSGRGRATLLWGTLGTYLLVELDTVAMVAARLPEAVGPPLVDVARALFVVVQPPSIGLWLLLAGCLLAHRDAATDG